MTLFKLEISGNNRRRKRKKKLPVASGLFCFIGQSEEKSSECSAVSLLLCPGRYPSLGSAYRSTPISGWFSQAANKQAGRLSELRNDPPVPVQLQMSPEPRRHSTKTVWLLSVLTPLSKWKRSRPRLGWVWRHMYVIPELWGYEDRKSRIQGYSWLHKDLRPA